MAKVPGKARTNVFQLPAASQPVPPEPYIAMAMSTMAKMGRLFTPTPGQPQSPQAGELVPVLGTRD